MKLKNRIINYFVVPPRRKGEMPRVFSSKVTIDAETAKKLLQDQLKKKDDGELPHGTLLHVCYDVDSGMIYLPNTSLFHKDQLTPLLQAAQIRITKDFGSFSNRPPIEGDPFNSLRVRSIDNFSYVKDAVQKHFGGKIFQNLPVIEANLRQMPSTLKSLPYIYQNEEFTGGYISPSFASSIQFISEIDNSGRKRPKPLNLLTQKTPFILINISRGAASNATEKDWTVLSGYRDYLYDDTALQQEKYIEIDLLFI